MADDDDGLPEGITLLHRDTKAFRAAVQKQQAAQGRNVISWSKQAGGASVYLRCDQFVAREATYKAAVRAPRRARARSGGRASGRRRERRQGAPLSRRSRPTAKRTTKASGRRARRAATLTGAAVSSTLARPSGAVRAASTCAACIARNARGAPVLRICACRAWRSCCANARWGPRTAPRARAPNAMSEKAQSLWLCLLFVRARLGLQWPENN